MNSQPRIERRLQQELRKNVQSFLDKGFRVLDRSIEITLIGPKLVYLTGSGKSYKYTFGETNDRFA